MFGSIKPRGTTHDRPTALLFNGIRLEVGRRAAYAIVGLRGHTQPPHSLPSIWAIRKIFSARGSTWPRSPTFPRKVFFFKCGHRCKRYVATATIVDLRGAAHALRLRHNLHSHQFSGTNFATSVIPQPTGQGVVMFLGHPPT